MNGLAALTETGVGVLGQGRQSPRMLHEGPQAWGSWVRLVGQSQAGGRLWVCTHWGRLWGNCFCRLRDGNHMGEICHWLLRPLSLELIAPALSNLESHPQHSQCGSWPGATVSLGVSHSRSEVIGSGRSQHPGPAPEVSTPILWTPWFITLRVPEHHRACREWEEETTDSPPSPHGESGTVGRSRRQNTTRVPEAPEHRVRVS